MIFSQPFFVVGNFEYKMSNTYSKLQMVFHGRPYLQTCIDLTQLSGVYKRSVILATLARAKIASLIVLRIMLSSLE